MNQYTNPEAEPKRKAAARNLANVILTPSAKGRKKKTSQTAKVDLLDQSKKMHNFE